MMIVGASPAGATAASTLRTEGFDGRILLLGEEPELPYERPPLSKGYLTGDTPRGQVHLHEQSFYAELDVELRTRIRGGWSWTSPPRGGAAPSRLVPIGSQIITRPPARNAHRNHPALRRAAAVGLLVLLTWGLTGCGDPDGGGGGGGGYVAQQASLAPGPH